MIYLIITLVVLVFLNVIVSVMNFLASVNYHARLEEIEKEIKRIGEFFG